MVRLDKIYTKDGDGGETGLGDGSRVAKYDLRIAAMGAVDEANSAIGIARLDAEGESDAMLGRIQNDLFDLGADLSAPEDGRKAEGRLRIAPAQVERLEREIDAMNARLEPLTSFVLPGGTALAAHLHLARAIMRRAERLIAELAARETINPAALHYANRLSDHLFVMARAANNDGMGDVLWVPGANPMISWTLSSKPERLASSSDARTRRSGSDRYYSGPSLRPKIKARITPITPVTAQPGKTRNE